MEAAQCGSSEGSSDTFGVNVKSPVVGLHTFPQRRSGAWGPVRGRQSGWTQSGPAHTARVNGGCVSSQVQRTQGAGRSKESERTGGAEGPRGGRCLRLPSASQKSVILFGMDANPQNKWHCRWLCVVISRDFGNISVGCNRVDPEPLSIDVFLASTHGSDMQTGLMAGPQHLEGRGPGWRGRDMPRPASPSPDSCVLTCTSRARPGGCVCREHPEVGGTDPLDYWGLKISRTRILKPGEVSFPEVSTPRRI